jgi:hypothetical protein
MLFLQSEDLLNYSSILWFDSMTVRSQYSLLHGISKDFKGEKCN